MAVTHHKSSRTIRGKNYAYNGTFVCYAANKGNGGSEGNGGSAAALTKGATYTFKGYAIDDDTGSLTAYPYLIADSNGNTRGWYKENVFPYATYKVTYNANGGSGAPAAQTKTYGTALTLSSTKPTRSGYTFVGWGTTASDTTSNYSPGGSYTSNAAITLYAIWKKTITITYNANGGSGAPSSQSATVYNATTSKSFTLSSTKPTRTGYSFLGWSTSSSATTATYSAGGSITLSASDTLYAVWKANTYKVTYNANGGTGAPSSQTKTHGVALTLSGTKPTRANYTFKGWGTSASATTVSYAAGASYTGNANLTLYAIWELAYRKPRITNFSVSRCDSSGTAANDGTYALVAFDWATDQTVSSIAIKWKLSTDTSYSSSTTASASGTSGSVSKVVGAGAFAAGNSYDIQVIVTDGNGSEDATKTLASQSLTISGKPGGDGVSFGKTAELGKEDSLGGTGVAEFEYDGKFNFPVYGKALGMDRLPEIPAGSHLNDYINPGCFAIYSNASAATIYAKEGVLMGGETDSLPPARAGRLEVWSATGEGVRAEQWSYIRQRFIPYNSTNAVWEREITRGSDNVWTYYDWWRSSLTPTAAEKVYNKTAITIKLTENVTLGKEDTYTKVPFDSVAVATNDRLTLSDRGVRIGPGISYVKVSGQTLVKCGSKTGNRHARIRKLSSGVTTSVAWTCIYGVATTNTLYPFVPVIVPVKEGDILTLVYYTGDIEDMNVSGSTTNGPQSYLTVEEL